MAGHQIVDLENPMGVVNLHHIISIRSHKGIRMFSQEENTLRRRICSQEEITRTPRCRKDKNVAQCNHSTEIKLASNPSLKDHIPTNNVHLIQALQELNQTEDLVLLKV
mmetsp:Transcript_28013/g.60015  ORF Transcript_28013/g.60015 Transcript_28013/m.60015 type:complete len:109 (+) Transcript_28013:350-676(+)